MRTPLALALVALTSTAFADARHDKLMKQFQAAIAKGGTALEPLVDADIPLRIIGLHFPSSECEKTFGSHGGVMQAQLPAFAACLKELKLVRDGDVFVAEPGVEVDVAFAKNENRILVILAQENVPAKRAEKQLAATANIAPDAMSLAGVSEETPFLAVDIALCVAEDGSVESARVERYNVVDAGVWADQILATTKRTVYKPFLRYGTPVRVCTHQRHVHPAVKRKAGIAELERLQKKADDEPLKGGPGGGEWGEEGGVVGGVVGGDIGDGPSGPPPPPPPPPPAVPQNVPPTLLEQYRTKGSKLILPNAKTKEAIVKSGKDKIVGSFKLCIDTRGVVVTVSMLKSTGFPDYDSTIQTEMRAWRYSPYRVNSTAVPVCTAVTFIYSQK